MNSTGGLPEGLKNGLEHLSGFNMADVRVQYNSPEPARFGAHAFAQGSNIHIAPGQQQHLPHEAWHVVQQKQGRVKSTHQFKSQQFNIDTHLEREADLMGTAALSQGLSQGGMHSSNQQPIANAPAYADSICIQAKLATFGEVDNNISLDVNGQRRLNLDQGKKATVSQRPTPNTGDDEGLGSTLTTSSVLPQILWKCSGPDYVNGQSWYTPLSESDLTFQSSITWCSRIMKSGGSADQIEGYSMTADPLGPDHKMGSAPGQGNDKDWVIRRKLLSRFESSNKYIAGHLLNADLGGPGNAPQNLAAISDMANAQHKKIEQRVKADVNRNGSWGKYEVKLNKNSFTYGDSYTVDYASDLEANWIPYGFKTSLESITNAQGTLEFIKVVEVDSSGKPVLHPIASRAINMKFDIPKPTSKASEATINTSSSPVDFSLEGVKTFIQPDEIVLTSDTSLIVHSVANKIKTLLQTQTVNLLEIAKKEELLHYYSDWLLRLQDEVNQQGQDLDDHAKLIEIIEHSNDDLVAESHRLRQDNERLRDERNLAEREWDHYYERSLRYRDERDYEHDENVRLKRGQRDMEEELRQLRRENARLKRENYRLDRQSKGSRVQDRDFDARQRNRHYSAYGDRESNGYPIRDRRRSWQDDK